MAGRPDRQQMIISAINFLMCFYELKPHSCWIFRRDIDRRCGFNPQQSRRWIDAASRILPLVKDRDEYYGKGGEMSGYRLQYKIQTRWRLSV